MAILSTNYDFWCFQTFPENCLGCHFWQYKPPGGCRGQIQLFLKTQISDKSRVWKRFGWLILMIFCDLSGTDNSVALTFQGRSYEYGNEIYCIWEVGRSLAFFGPPPPTHLPHPPPKRVIEKITRKLMFPGFVRPDGAKIRRESIP